MDCNHPGTPSHDSLIAAPKVLRNPLGISILGISIYGGYFHLWCTGYEQKMPGIPHIFYPNFPRGFRGTRRGRTASPWSTRRSSKHVLARLAPETEAKNSEPRTPHPRPKHPKFQTDHRKRLCHRWSNIYVFTSSDDRREELRVACLTALGEGSLKPIQKVLGTHGAWSKPRAWPTMLNGQFRRSQGLVLGRIFGPSMRCLLCRTAA